MSKQALKKGQRPGFHIVVVAIPDEVHIQWLKFLNSPAGKFKKMGPRLLEHILDDIEQSNKI